MIQCIVKNNLTRWYTIFTNDHHYEGPCPFDALSKEAVAFIDKCFVVQLGQYDGGFLYTVYMLPVDSAM